ncbi:LytR/AlgR family response regulator transcription factor [Ningiella sp. W23]|uniref:LytR/AlgR family response regulator transcription factor n=1 Tax=Ningiella sp. W23 TaxID=3023715 RepID=UPI0037574CF2
MDKITALIVDDEPLAREGLLRLVCQHDRFVVTQQCSDGQQALDAIETLKPDVVFLDIEMPIMNGIELAADLHQSSKHSHTPVDGQAHIPKIVFVTAFREYALDAFEFQASDYLLKPFSQARVNQCLNNLVQLIDVETKLNLQGKLDQLISRKTGESLDGFVKRLESSRYRGIADLHNVITMKSGNDYLRIPINSLLWIEAAGDYMCVHTLEGTHIIRKTLKQFEQELSGEHFTRINRSAIVNVSKISKLSPNSNGEYIAILSSGDELKVTRSYKQNLEGLSGHA